MPNYVFLALDVEDWSCARLNPDRAESFPAQMRATSNLLREEFGIPTIAITYALKGEEFRVYASEIMDPSQANKDARAAIIKQQGLTKFAPHPEDIIVVKGMPDAFCRSGLEDLLQEIGADAGLLGGSQTSLCVPSTYIGSCYTNFPMTIFPDLLSDSTTDDHEGSNGNNPQWHIDKVKEAIGICWETGVDPETVPFVLSTDFIAEQRALRGGNFRLEIQSEPLRLSASQRGCRDRAGMASCFNKGNTFRSLKPDSNL